MGYKIGDSSLCYSCQAPIEYPVNVCRDYNHYYHQTLICQEVHSRLCLYKRQVQRFDNQRDFSPQK